MRDQRLPGQLRVRVGVESNLALGRLEAGRDDGDLHVLAERLVDARAEDDVRILVRLLLHEARSFLDLLHLEVRSADDVDEHPGRALDADVVEQRRGDRHLRREARAVLALGDAGAHERAAHVAHHRLHVGEVDVDDPVLRDEVTDALDGLIEHLVGLAAGIDEGEVVVAEEQELLVGDRDECVDLLGEHRQADLGAACALASLEEEGLGDDADGQGPLLARDLRDDGCGTGSRSTAHAGGDEDHVGSAQELLDALDVFQRRLASLVGIRTCAETARDVRTDGELGRGGVRVERLSVGVDDDELDPFEAEVDHRVHGVAAGAADADDLDARLVLLLLVRELDREAHRPLPPIIVPSLASTGTHEAKPSNRNRFVGAARTRTSARLIRTPP